MLKFNMSCGVSIMVCCSLGVLIIGQLLGGTCLWDELDEYHGKFVCGLYGQPRMRVVPFLDGVKMCHNLVAGIVTNWMVSQ